MSDGDTTEDETARESDDTSISGNITNVPTPVPFTESIPSSPLSHWSGQFSSCIKKFHMEGFNPWEETSFNIRIIKKNDIYIYSILLGRENGCFYLYSKRKTFRISVLLSPSNQIGGKFFKFKHVFPLYIVAVTQKMRNPTRIGKSPSCWCGGLQPITSQYCLSITHQENRSL